MSQHLPLRRHKPFSEMSKQDLLNYAAEMAGRYSMLLELKREQQFFPRRVLPHEQQAELSLLEQTREFFEALAGDLLAGETMRIETTERIQG